jgi:hypothetical protein
MAARTISAFSCDITAQYLARKDIGRDPQPSAPYGSGGVKASMRG